MDFTLRSRFWCQVTMKTKNNVLDKYFKKTVAGIVFSPRNPFHQKSPVRTNDKFLLPCMQEFDYAKSNIDNFKPNQDLVSFHETTLTLNTQPSFRMHFHQYPMFKHMYNTHCRTQSVIFCYCDSRKCHILRFVNRFHKIYTFRNLTRSFKFFKLPPSGEAR